MPTRRPRPLGRPPASNSAETRQRILDVARETFAELGWGATTNKDLATKAGITSGALYHYFDSKLDIYLAVYDEVQEAVGERFREAIATGDSFVDQFSAVLDMAHQMNAEDPSLAQFVGSCRVDISRHEELHRPIQRRLNVAAAIVAQLVDRAVVTGEITRSQREQLGGFVRTVLTGLTDALSGDLSQHQAAIDAVRGILAGQFLHPAKAAKSQRAIAPPTRRSPSPSGSRG